MALKRAVVKDEVQTTEAAVVGTEVQTEDPGVTQVIDKEALAAAVAEANGEQAPGTEVPDDQAEAEAAGTEQPEDQAKPEAEPEAQAKPEAEEFETQAVAVRSETTAVASPGAAPGHVGGAMAAFKDEMAAEGFEGMNLTGMSFDRVKLHEGQFLLGSEETKLGETIHVQIMSTREIYVVRQYSGNGAEMFYSYDKAGKFKTDGSSAEEVLAEWLADGFGTPEAPLEIKTYIEAMAVLVNRTDDYEQHMVSLSIPPASKDRLAGAFAVGRQRLKASPTQLVIECKVGAKVGSGEEAFRPWIFKAHSVAE